MKGKTNIKIQQTFKNTKQVHTVNGKLLNVAALFI